MNNNPQVKLIERAEQARKEMIAEGVNGWPNTVQDLISVIKPHIDSLQSRVAELEDARMAALGLYGRTLDDAIAMQASLSEITAERDALRKAIVSHYQNRTAEDYIDFTDDQAAIDYFIELARTRWKHDVDLT